MRLAMPGSKAGYLTNLLNVSFKLTSPSARQIKPFYNIAKFKIGVGVLSKTII